MKDIRIKFSLLLVIFSVLGITGCSDKEDESLYSKWENCLDNHTANYAFDNQGRCFGDGGGISQENFEKMVTGHGWKNYGTWEIDESGKRLPDDFYKNVFGVNPANFYFAEGNKITTYRKDDSKANSMLSKTQSYSFDGRYEGVPRSVILLEDGTYAQITGWDLGIHPSFCAVYPLGLKRNNKDVYGVSIFVQMTEKELKEFQDACKL